MKFKTFKEFNNEFTFELVNEMKVLKRVQEIATSAAITDLAKQSLQRILDAQRPQVHKDFYKKVQYVSYVNCLLGLNITESFEKLYDILFEYGWNVSDLQTIKAEYGVV